MQCLRKWESTCRRAQSRNNRICATVIHRAPFHASHLPNSISCTKWKAPQDGRGDVPPDCLDPFSDFPSLARPASAKNRLARRGMKIILRQRNFVFHIPPFNTQPPLFPEFFPFLPFFFSHPKPVDNLKVPLSLIFV